jgi:DNA-binding LytR/AlgR family response regulator
VFVTAYDQHALAAFERSAVDYLLKPVQTQRLAQTCERLRGLLAQRASGGLGDAALAQLRGLLAGAGAPPPQATALRVLQAGVGNTLHLVPLAEVIYFEAADKYVRVLTREREHLLRSALRELLPQLDPQQFWQIHRGTVVRADAIASATRDDNGRYTLVLRDRPEKLAVSRLYTHLFKAM